MSYFIERDSFKTYPKDNVAIIKIKDKVFDLVTDIEESEYMIDFIKKTEYDNDVSAILIINEAGCYSEDVYNQFIHEIIEHHTLTDKEGIPSFAEKDIRFREINILNKIIRSIADYQKLFFTALNGDVVTPFMGTALAADFRYATEGSSIIMAHNKFGLHPSGALPFFLTQYLNHSRAMEILLSRSISTETAKDLGLINQLFSTENFEEQCLDEILVHLQCRTCTVRRTKQLTNFTRKELHDYFHFEAGLLNL